jgi:hypothetical protein
MFTDVSEERATSIFREEEGREQPVPFYPEDKQYGSPETSVSVYKTTRCYIPEDSNLHRPPLLPLLSFGSQVSSVSRPFLLFCSLSVDPALLFARWKA